MKNNKIDRPEGTLVKKYKLVTDVNAIPQGITPELYVKLSDSGHIFYDSSKGNRPKLYQFEQEDEFVPEFHDVSGKEIDIDLLTKQLEDDEFWRKELYKCKQSPLYYFQNYVSTTPKPTQQEIDLYLDSKGFGAKNDSDSAAETNEDIIKIRERFAEEITLEKLKNLKPVRDRIDQEYSDKTEELRKLASTELEISYDNEKKLTEKIITSIMKTSTKESCPELKYYVNENNGRWNKQMFKVTDFDILLRLWMLR